MPILISEIEAQMGKINWIAVSKSMKYLVQWNAWEEIINLIKHDLTEFNSSFSPCVALQCIFLSIISKSELNYIERIKVILQ